MKIELGKTYLTKGGSTVRFVHLTSTGDLLGQDDEGHLRVYSGNGRMSHGPSAADIWKEREPDPPKIVLKFGRKYKTRDGRVVDIRSMNGLEPFIAIGYLPNSDVPDSWSINGHHSHNSLRGSIDGMDIVEEL